MNKEIQNYLKKMEKFNNWENKQISSPQNNLKRFFLLMEFGYHFFSKSKIEEYRKEKITSISIKNKKGKLKNHSGNT